ncbi:MAG: sigma-54-dependent Fis family transcriptional regulator [Bacteroidia bacterium]|nr:sigma-54-dependent Fis family transcriptional regulator [Bacteroidia bacterium]
MKELNILLVSQHESIRKEVREVLLARQFVIYEASNAHECFEILEKYPIDIALIRENLPGRSGMDILKEIKDRQIDTEVIMGAETITRNDLMRALHLGASDFLALPACTEDIVNAIDQTISTRKLAWQLRINPVIASDNDIKYTFKGQSKKIRQIHMLARQVAHSHCNSVLLTGESGTGKEVVARAIHKMSRRNNHPFIAVNCSAVPEELFESSFFGYVKGTFTGAAEDRPGWFEMADGGTLMLDEIGDLKYSLQSKLLRVLDDMVIRRLGSRKETKVNVRIIAATNQNLEEKIANGKFRSDLYHRLTHFRISLPTLRERKEDIPLLLEHFASYFSTINGKTLYKFETEIPAHLMEYDFPGNVRELKNMVERAMILCTSNTLRWRHFQPFFSHSVHKPETEIPFQSYNLTEIEEEIIRQALENYGWNKTRAADALNITRQSLERRILKHQIYSPSQK